MAAFNIQEALIWKEKIEYVIDQVCFKRLHNPIMVIDCGLISMFLNFLLKFISLMYIDLKYEKHLLGTKIKGCIAI